MASSSKPRSKSRTGLAAAVGRLSRHYGATRSVAPDEPFEILLWEYVAYLTDDADRAAAFSTLRSRIGLSPDEVATAPSALVESLCRAGGAIAFASRARRIHDAAVRVRDDLGGSLKSVLRLPYAEARRVLKTFPSIGPPGADKILLLTGSQPVLALDSNALRVLLRLGYGEEQKSYGASYTSAQRAAAAELKPSIPALQKASLLLRRHGQDLCRRMDPRCPICPLEPTCRFAQSRMDASRKP